MKFNLNFDPPVSPVTISHRHKIVLTGSCFAENIGESLTAHRFQCTTNLGGIIFDAVSLARYLRNAVNDMGSSLPENHILERGGHFFTYLYHSSVSAVKKEALQK